MAAELLGVLVCVVWTTGARMWTPRRPHRKTDQHDPVTWPALIFRIVDDPSRTGCALVLICPLLAAALLRTDAGSPTLWVGVVSAGILIIRKVIGRKRAAGVDTSDDAAAEGKSESGTKEG